MSKEQMDVIRTLSSTLFKGIGIILLSMVGFLAVDAYETLKNNQTENRQDLKKIQESVDLIRYEQERVRMELQQIQKTLN